VLGSDLYGLLGGFGLRLEAARFRLDPGDERRFGGELPLRFGSGLQRVLVVGRDEARFRGRLPPGFRVHTDRYAVGSREGVGVSGWLGGIARGQVRPDVHGGRHGVPRWGRRWTVLRFR
jgi:hypothetical protein